MGILSAENVTKSFKTRKGDIEVLRGIDFKAERGEVVAILGASGAGKSTLLHVLGTLDVPDSGQVLIRGKDPFVVPQKELNAIRNRDLGFVFQFHYLLEDFSALENVMMPLLVMGKSKSEARERGELLLRQAGLTDRAGHRPRQLSGGEQQRVAVARALANNPDIVLADEPSGNLDTETGRKLHDLLFQLNDENGTTFLIATHNIELAARCDRVLEIKDGILSEKV